MITYIGGHPQYNVFIVGTDQRGRIPIDIPEEKISEYEEVILKFIKVQQELYEFYKGETNGK